VKLWELLQSSYKSTPQLQAIIIPSSDAIYHLMPRMKKDREIVALDSLKKNYESHEQRLKFCRSYDLCLADDRIVRLFQTVVVKDSIRNEKLGLIRLIDVKTESSVAISIVTNSLQNL